MLLWDIPVLDNTPGQNQAVLVISVTIASGIRAGGKIVNRARATYETNDLNPVSYSASSNSVIVKIPALTINKTVSPQSVALGDTLLYTIKVIIPDGVAAPNLVIHDIIPEGQTYIPESWTPGPPPVQTSNSLVFTNPQALVIGPLTLIYTFQTIVTHASFPPYTEVQTNYACVQWSIISICPGSPVCASADVRINTPNLTSLKEQRKVSNGSVFTTEPIHNVFAGDTIEYRITLTNNGEGTAYNVNTADVLDPLLNYLGIVGTPPPGDVFNSVPLSSPGGTLRWSNFNLSAGSSAVLTFQVLINTNFPFSSPVADQASTTYTSNAEL